MSAIKICIPLTNRAAYGRLRSVILELKDSTKFAPIVILCGAALLDKYGDLRPILRRDNITWCEEIYCVTDGDLPLCMAITQGQLTQQLAQLFSRIKPDAVIVHADRYEMLSAAIAANYLNIKVIHMQGGESSGGVDDDVRRAITALADIHFPATKKSESVLRSLVPANRVGQIYNIGCPSIDIIRAMEEDSSLYSLSSADVNSVGIGKTIDVEKEYVLAMLHPDTRISRQDNVDELKFILNILSGMQLQIVLIWPNVDSGSDLMSAYIRKMYDNNKLYLFRICKNFDPETFYKLLNKCKFFVGNSSSGIREGSYLEKTNFCFGNRQVHRETCGNTISVSVHDVVDVSTNNFRSKFRAALVEFRSGDRVLQFGNVADTDMWGLMENWNYSNLESNFNSRSLVYGTGFAAKRMLTILEGIEW